MVHNSSRHRVPRGNNLYERTIASPTTELIVGLAVLGGVFYMGFLLNPQYRGDILPYIMVIVAEFYLITQGILSFWTILGGRYNPRNHEYHQAQGTLFGDYGSKITEKHLNQYRPEQTSKFKLYIENKPVSV